MLCKIYSNQLSPDQAFSKQDDAPPIQKPKPYSVTSIFNPPPNIQADIPATPKNFSLVLSVTAPYPAAERAGTTFSLVLFEKADIPAFSIPLLSLLYYLWANYCNQ